MLRPKYNQAVSNAKIAINAVRRLARETLAIRQVIAETPLNLEAEAS